MGYHLDQENEKENYSEGAEDRREDRSGGRRIATVVNSGLTPLALVSTIQKIGGYTEWDGGQRYVVGQQKGKQ